MDPKDLFGKDLGSPTSPSPEITLVETAAIQIMNEYTFVTIQETDEILYYKDGVYIPGCQIIIAKEAENTYHFEINSSKVT